MCLFVCTHDLTIPINNFRSALHFFPKVNQIETKATIIDDGNCKLSRVVLFLVSMYCLPTSHDLFAKTY
jgi:hypothetical protein